MIGSKSHMIWDSQSEQLVKDGNEKQAFTLLDTGVYDNNIEASRAKFE